MNVKKPFIDMPKHSLIVNGKRTSVSLEIEFWEAFREIAKVKQVSMNDLASDVARLSEKLSPQPNLSSAIRLYVLKEMQEQAAKVMA